MLHADRLPPGLRRARSHVHPMPAHVSMVKGSRLQPASAAEASRGAHSNRLATLTLVTAAGSAPTSRLYRFGNRLARADDTVAARSVQRGGIRSGVAAKRGIEMLQPSGAALRLKTGTSRGASWETKGRGYLQCVRCGSSG